MPNMITNEEQRWRELRDVAADRPARPHTAETVQIEAVRFRDAAGNPTCAADFEAGLVCKFYTTQRFGCSETCLFADKTGPRGLWRTMRRRKDGGGTLIPMDACPLWPNVEVSGHQRRD